MTHVSSSSLDMISIILESIGHCKFTNKEWCSTTLGELTMSSFAYLMGGFPSHLDYFFLLSWQIFIRPLKKI
jgi:hypothetical protein